jgi:hypothetical protein
MEKWLNNYQGPLATLRGVEFTGLLPQLVLSPFNSTSAIA